MLCVDLRPTTCMPRTWVVRRFRCVTVDDDWITLRDVISINESLTLQNADSKYIILLWSPMEYGRPLYFRVVVCSFFLLFSERELTFTFTFAICYRPSVCLSSVTFVRPTQAVQIFGNISTAFGALAIRWHPLKISRRSSQGNPSAGGVKHKRGSKI